MIAASVMWADTPLDFVSSARAIRARRNCLAVATWNFPNGIIDPVEILIRQKSLEFGSVPRQLSTSAGLAGVSAMQRAITIFGPKPVSALCQAGALAASLALVPFASANAETLYGALIRAYQTNPQLNAERARQRGTDEAVPIALSGYRPQIMAGLSGGLLSVRNLMPGGESQSATLKGWKGDITATQTLFNGFKTGNTVRQAESQVRAGREMLRNVEQSVLLDAVSAYMDVVANQSFVEAQRLNLNFLRETLSATQRRVEAGDVTATDLAQAEARVSRATADLNNAEVLLAISRATYEQVIGSPPGRLAAAEPIDRLLPRAREDALAVGHREHPTIIGAQFEVDAAQYAIKISESALYPTIGVQGSVSREVNMDPTLGMSRSDQASILGQMKVPVYDGGMASAQVRQAKEVLSQTRTQLDRVRLQTQTAVVAAWMTNEGTRVSLNAAEAEVRAATIALSGVQRENQVGQRSTLELLNSQQDLATARSRLIQVKRDRVVASYTLLSAIGRLDHARLGLQTPDYDPQVHYQQVRDAWHGLRTPSGQ